MSTTVGDFLNKRPGLFKEIKDFLGVLANTEYSNFSKGWEEAAVKLNERYPSFDRITILLFKSKGLSEAAESFLSYLGSLCVKLDDLIWALCYSGNDFVANKLVQALGPSVANQTSHNNMVSVQSKSVEQQAPNNVSTAPAPVYDQAPPANLQFQSNCQAPSIADSICRSNYQAPSIADSICRSNYQTPMMYAAPTYQLAPAPLASKQFANPIPVVSDTEVAQQAALLAQFKAPANINVLARHFLTPHKYMTMCRQLGVQGLPNMMDWKTFSYKLPDIKYSEISHLYNREPSSAAQCFLRWWLMQPSATLRNMYNALKAIGYMRLLSDIQLTESTQITKPLPQPVTASTLMREAFDFESFEQLCEYLNSTNQWRAVCQQLGMSKMDIDTANLLSRENAVAELLAKWSEKMDARVKHLMDALESTSNPRILYDIGVLKNTV